MNVAVSSTQAHSVFFKPLRSLIVDSPAFEGKFEGDIPSPAALELKFKKRIELISGHSSYEGLEGKNLLAAIADEIAAFPTISESRVNRTGRTPVKTAEGILEMLSSSASTRFPFNYKLAKISYPRFKGDAIQTAVQEARDDIAKRGADSVFYVSGPHKTWDVNPLYDTIPRVKVPGASEPIPNAPIFLKDYADRPAYARAKFECAPELSANPFFEDISYIESAFSAEVAREPLVLRYHWGVDESQEDTTAQREWSPVDAQPFKEQPGWQVTFHFAPSLRPIQGAVYALHGDMAITGDAAGVAMSHVQSWERREWHTFNGPTVEMRPVVKVDFVTAFEADAAALNPAGTVSAREVQIRWYRKLIEELLRRGFRIGHITFDNFQSADLLQTLKSRGLNAKRFSTDTSNLGWETIRDLSYEGRLNGYHVPFVTADGIATFESPVVSELKELTQLNNGLCDHKPGGGKDRADALAGAVVGALTCGGDETGHPQYADDPDDTDNLFTVAVSRGTSDAWQSADGVGDLSVFGDTSFASFG